MRLLLATRNAHKLREFERILAAADARGAGEGDAGGEGAAAAVDADAGRPGGGWQIDPLPQEVVLPPEDGSTFAENALGKARAAAAASGRVSIADDSGIAAEVLGGDPGVRSARYAGERAGDEENLAKLIREVPAGSRLEYICALAYVDPARGLERVFEGRCRGTRAETARGSRGFGYDPVFLPDDGPDALTMAELDDAQKDTISHRGRAARELAAWLRAGSTGG